MPYIKAEVKNICPQQCPFEEQGIILQPGNTFIIPDSERLEWAEDTDVIAAIVDGRLRVLDDQGNALGVQESIDRLLNY